MRNQVTRRHSSFLIRCWDIRDGIHRVEIEHIQSGDTMRFRSVADAIEWIEAHHELTVAPESPPLAGGSEDKGTM
jgi:hypothetical protein